MKLSTLCPSNYISLNVSTSMDQIQLSLKGTLIQHQNFYISKEGYDTILKFEEKQYFVHKSILQKHSLIFNKEKVQKNGQRYFIELKAKGKKQLFERIITSIYGFTNTIRRCQIHEAYQICKVLELEELIKVFHSDMLNRFQEYDIFPLLKLANEQQITNIVHLCFDQLEIEQYEPMRYNKSGLFICGSELFKMIIRRHNDQKQNSQRYGLSLIEIQSIIDDYCDIHSIHDKKKQQFIKDIDERQGVKYFITTPLKSTMTPRRIKSSSQIFFRNTLTLPRQKKLQKNNSFDISDKSNEKVSDCFDSESDNGQSSQIAYNRYSRTSNYEQKSVSNYSTDHKSGTGRSRKQSFGSVESLLDPRLVSTFNTLNETQKSISESTCQMKRIAEEMCNKLEDEIKTAKLRNSKLDKLNSFLSEIEAQFKSNSLRLEEIDKTVTKIVSQSDLAHAKKTFNSLFDTSIELQLTVSTEFGQKKEQIKRK